MREWISGRNPVYELFRAGRRKIFRLWLAKGVQEKGRIQDIIDLATRAKMPIEYLPRARLEALSSGSQGVAVEVSAFPYATLYDILDVSVSRKEPPFILILDALQDPQNMGTLLRTAEAVGIHGVLLPLRRTATVTPAVVNASSGASEHLLVAQANLAQVIAELKEREVWVIGLEGGPQASLPDQVHLNGALALVVGNEGEGMRSLVRSSCDSLLRLPMRGRVESLNAAVAGSLVLYLAWQARGFSDVSRG